MNISDSKSIEAIIRVLRGGGVVVVPTDTVYGLACDACDANAVEKLFLIKERNRGKAIPVFVDCREMLDQIARVDEQLATVLFSFWPGALTAVLPAQNVFPEALLAGTSTVGVRIPNYSFILDLIREYGKPLAVTSANKSGEGASTRIARVEHDLQEGVRPDLLIDAGDLSESALSTVIDCTKTPPVILREGVISKKDFFEVADQYFKSANY